MCFGMFSDVSTREIHLTGVQLSIVWRRNRRLPKNPTSSGPLTDLPDYSYMDGRPTPLGVSFSFFRYWVRWKLKTKNLRDNRIQWNRKSFLLRQVWQKYRLDCQRQIAQKIVKGIQEVDFAKQRYQSKLLATEEERQSLLDGKLKPKGKLLLKKGTSP